MLRAGSALFLAAAVVAGCTSISAFPGQTRYYGTKIDLFFLEWGAPVASHDLEYGGKEYLWYSGRRSAYIPGHTDSELIGNDAWWRGYRIRWFNPRLECGVRIITAPDSTIRDVRLQESSQGWWQSQRCYEVFGPPVQLSGVGPPP